MTTHNSPLRIGAVSFLNVAPLVYSLETEPSERYVVIRDTPARLSEMLKQGEIDVGINPVAEYFRGVGAKIVPGICIGSDGPVASIKLFSKLPFEEIRTVVTDAASRTSVELTRVILGEGYGCHPSLESSTGELEDSLATADAALLIGDRALTATPLPEWRVLDLGEQWKKLTGRPFVFALWVTRAGALEKEINELLQKAKQVGLQRIDEVCREKPYPLSVEGAKHYLTHNVQFDLTSDFIEGLILFAALCQKYGVLKDLRPLEFIGE